MKRTSVLFSLLLVLLLGVGTITIVAEVSSSNGLPVDGEITGWVTEVIASEAGVDVIAIGSETEPYDDLFITNAAGDLDQFGDLLIQGLVADAPVTLTVMNNDLVNVTLKTGNVWCCYGGLCRRVKPSKCADNNGTEYSSQRACDKNCE